MTASGEKLIETGLDRSPTVLRCPPAPQAINDDRDG